MDGNTDHQFIETILMRELITSLDDYIDDRLY